jgi:hypothetical protein
MQKEKEKEVAIEFSIFRERTSPGFPTGAFFAG